MQNILSSVGLSEKDLFNNKSENVKPRIVKTYIYTDEEGKELYVALRFEPKDFRPAHRKDTSSDWIFNLQGIKKRVPYNLPEIIKSDVVFFVEGEKDADNLNSIGLCATTTISGANGFGKYSYEYAKYFKDKKVYIIPDNDTPGKEYAETVMKALEVTAEKVKILDLLNVVPDLKQKGDISDVLLKYGAEKTLEMLKTLVDTDINIENMTAKEIISIKFFNVLYDLETNERQTYLDLKSDIKAKLNRSELADFKKEYENFKKDKKSKKKEEAKEGQIVAPGTGLYFKGLNENIYNTQRYYMDNEERIWTSDNNGFPQLISYQPIIPIEEMINVEDKTHKIRLAYKERNKWETLIVEQTDISIAKNLTDLSTFGIKANSENAKSLIKYFAEIQALNEDKIPQVESVSRMGWFDGELIPYSEKYIFDKQKENPEFREIFEEKGTLEEWVDYFIERRKYSMEARMLMAACVTSLILKELKQPGFTVNIHGQTGTGKTVGCFAAISIFGHPDKIGMNFNTTMAGLESRLNMYNNLPLLINEMQHKKDDKNFNFDSMLFLISEGAGRTRSTKYGGNAKDNRWQNVVITNGEKIILKDNSDGGAINRVLIFELTHKTYENLPEVVNFAREHYGTAIREIIEHFNEFNLREIYEEKLKVVDEQETSDKQKIIKALLLVGDKLVVDILFKDKYYLTANDFSENNISKRDIYVETRAYESVMEWYASCKNRFEIEGVDKEIREPMYGKVFSNGYIAFFKDILAKQLETEGFDSNQIFAAWKRKGYTRCEDKKSTIKRVINGERVRCILLKMNMDSDDEDSDDLEDLEDERPF